MKTVNQLVNNLAGQLKGINKMIDSDKDCIDVITQMKAVKAGVNSVINKYLQENFKDCAKKSYKSGDQQKINKIIFEITKNN